LGGKVIEAGKPSAPIYDLALARAGEAAGASIDRSRVLAIGDGLATDLAGARAQALDAMFVADGIHAAEVMDASGGIDETALNRLFISGAPAYVIESLIW
jgi:ribonucleotide monophosphatase NagD (HAD superfamily)